MRAMPVRTCRWVRRNPSGRAGDFIETWIRFQLDPAPGGRGNPEQHDVEITISLDVVQLWQLPEAERGRVLFWAAVQEGVVRGRAVVNLTTDNAPQHCPDDWRRAEPQQSAPFQVEFPARPIGFGD
jgi:hypothetical protein